MANKSTVIRITHAKNDVSAWRIARAAGAAREEALALARLFERIAGGQEKASFEVEAAGTALVRASATATIVAAGATDSITINGVEFAGVASGASGNTWNVGSGGTADADSATRLAAAINGSVTAKVAGYVYATAAANVVTIYARAPGVAGNMFTLVDTGTTITVTGSGFLAGGTGQNAAPTSYVRT
jgi:hypothetical protein